MPRTLPPNPRSAHAKSQEALAFNKRSLILQNLSLLGSSLFLWAVARFLYIRAVHGDVVNFRKFDILFILATPILAFFLNWYWLREQRTDLVTKWTLSWSAADLLLFILTVVLFGARLHTLLAQI